MMQSLELGEPERSHMGSFPISMRRDQRHPVKEELEIRIGLVERDLPIWVVALPGIVQRLPPHCIEVSIQPTGFYLSGGVCRNEAPQGPCEAENGIGDTSQTVLTPPFLGHLG